MTEKILLRQRTCSGDADSRAIVASARSARSIASYRPDQIGGRTRPPVVQNGLVAKMALGLLTCATSLVAQDSSLLNRPPQTQSTPPLSLQDSSFMFQQPQPPKTLRLNDIVTIVVNVNSRVLSEGEMDARKRAQLDAVLSDWIKFSGGDLIPDAQRRGDPRVSGQYNSRFRAEGDLESRDSMTFTIAAKVVDIRPNGNLVIEARRTIENNSEMWQQSLTGTIRREDVSPDNKVLSEDVAELRIRKRETGQVRDAYRRGWLTRFFDMFQPI